MANYGFSGLNKNLNSRLSNSTNVLNISNLSNLIIAVRVKYILLDDSDKVLLPIGKKNLFNKTFEAKVKYKLDFNNNTSLDYSFTKKRAGDGLQAKVVKMVNSDKLVLYCNKQYVMNQNVPSNVILELLNPASDIKGTIR